MGQVDGVCRRFRTGAGRELIGNPTPNRRTTGVDLIHGAARTTAADTWERIRNVRVRAFSQTDAVSHNVIVVDPVHYRAVHIGGPGDERAARNIGEAKGSPVGTVDRVARSAGYWRPVQGNAGIAARCGQCRRSKPGCCRGLWGISAFCPHRIHRGDHEEVSRGICKTRRCVACAC